MKAHRVLVFALAIAIATTATASIKRDYDPETDFLAYKTWSFGDGTEAPNDLVQGRIEKAIETQLAAKGLTRDDNSPDLRVVTHAKVGSQTVISGSSFGYGWRGGYGSTMTTVDQVPIGTLVVDLVDAQDNELVWRSSGDSLLSSTPEKSQKKINKIVKKMFKKYPPNKK
jgi:hypothetical protein